MKEEYIKTYRWMNALRGGVLRDVYALIYQIGQRGVVCISADYISDRLGYSERNVQRAITELKETGWLEVEYTKGKRSVFRALTPDKLSVQTPDNLSSPDPRQIVVTPPTICRDTHDKLSSPTPYISSDKDLDYTTTTSSENARERFQKWFEESDLQEWVERQLYRSGFTDLSPATLIADFYDNDLIVRERCEQGERIETLRHFQNWLPKYLRKLKETQNIQNNGDNQSSNPPCSGSRRTTDLEELARSIAAGFAAGAARRTTQ